MALTSKTGLHQILGLNSSTRFQRFRASTESEAIFDALEFAGVSVHKIDGGAVGCQAE
jgi:hypothetical protein